MSRRRLLGANAGACSVSSSTRVGSDKRSQHVKKGRARLFQTVGKIDKPSQANDKTLDEREN